MDPYIADFACHRLKLVIEIDGSQHGSQVTKDEARTRRLESEGYRVLRFWNNEVLSNIEGVLTEIQNALAATPTPDPSPQGGGEQGNSAPTLPLQGRVKISAHVAQLLQTVATSRPTFAVLIREGCMLRDPAKDVMEKAYARWAPVYDVLCGPVFLNGRRAAASAARAVGGRILEIGVGTGLSFDDYDDTTEITGIDMSEPMIARARERAKTGRYPFVKELAVMDAHDLCYPDASFDCVVAQFVITLVEDPERVLSECARVLRPGGQIILVNHLYSEHGLAAAVERLLAQKARKLGLRPEFPFHASGGVGAGAWRRRRWWSGARSSRSGSTRWCAFNARTSRSAAA